MKHQAHYDDFYVEKFGTASADVELYVETWGNDRWSGDDPAKPFKSVLRAYQAMPIRNQYQYACNIGPGVFEYPLQVQNTAHINGHWFVGTTSVEESCTATNIILNLISTGIQVQDPSKAWTPGEHEGKQILWTSGALNGQKSAVHKNDATNMSVSCPLNAWTAPAPGDTFDILSHDTEIQLTTSTGGILVPFHTGNVSNQNSKVEYHDLHITSSVCALSGLNGAITYKNCRVETLYLPCGNNSTTFGFTSYFKPSQFWALSAAESSSVLLMNGCILNCNSLPCLLRHNGVLRLRGQTIIANLPAQGFQLGGVHASYEVAGSSILFDNCASGFKNKRDYSAPTTEINGGNHLELPECHGAIAGFLVEAGQGDKFFIPPASSVSTNGGATVNECTVDQSNESYYSYAKGIEIHGTGNEGSIALAADQTAIEVSYQKSKDGMWKTVANTVPTAITDFTGGSEGQTVLIIGGSSTNASTIAHGGNFVNLGGGTVTLNLNTIAKYQRVDGVWVQYA